MILSLPALSYLLPAKGPSESHGRPVDHCCRYYIAVNPAGRCKAFGLACRQFCGALGGRGGASQCGAGQHPWHQWRRGLVRRSGFAIPQWRERRLADAARQSDQPVHVSAAGGIARDLSAEFCVVTRDGAGERTGCGRFQLLSLSPSIRSAHGDDFDDIARRCLPIDIAYSRFAWDASQSLLATLFVLYLPLLRCPSPRRLRVGARLGHGGARRGDLDTPHKRLRGSAVGRSGDVRPATADACVACRIRRLRTSTWRLIALVGVSIAAAYGAWYWLAQDSEPLRRPAEWAGFRPELSAAVFRHDRLRVHRRAGCRRVGRHRVCLVLRRLQSCFLVPDHRGVLGNGLQIEIGPDRARCWPGDWLAGDAQWFFHRGGSRSDRAAHRTLRNLPDCAGGAGHVARIGVVDRRAANVSAVDRRGDGGRSRGCGRQVSTWVISSSSSRPADVRT